MRFHARAKFLGQQGEPCRVALRVQPPGRALQLVVGQELQVVSAGRDERVDQVVALVRSALHRVAGPAQRVEEPDGARRGVEADGVPHARVLRRVVGEQDGDLLLRVGDAPEAGEAGREPGEAGRALGVGSVERERRANRGAFAEALLEGEGDADDAAVELGDGDLPGCVERREACVRA